MKVLFFVHPGKNSRSQLTDILRGFTAAGHVTYSLDITSVVLALQNADGKEEQERIQAEMARQVTAIISEHGIEMSVGMWANGLMVTESPVVNGRLVTLFEEIRSPHLLIWLDSPERAHGETVRKHFKPGFFRLPYQFHYINNSQTASGDAAGVRV